MKSKWVGVLFLFLCILISFLFFTNSFLDPQVSTTIDVLLVGSLVIVTLYYAIKVSEQNELLQRQDKRSFYYDLIWDVLDPWIKRLSANCNSLKNIEIQYLMDQEKIHPGEEMISVFLQYQTLYIDELRSLYVKQMKEMSNYTSRLQYFLKNIENFINELWTKELDAVVNENVIKPGIYDKNDTIKWTVRKLLLSEEEFIDIHGFKKFDEKVWKPFFRTRLEILDSGERIKSLRSESMKLSRISEELRSKFFIVENSLAKEYNISLRDLQWRKQQMSHQLLGRRKQSALSMLCNE